MEFEPKLLVLKNLNYDKILCKILITKFALEYFFHSQAKERICQLIQSGVESGARLLLDGRNIVVS